MGVYPRLISAGLGIPPWGRCGLAWTYYMGSQNYVIFYEVIT